MGKVIKFPYERRGIIDLKPEWEIKEKKSIIINDKQLWNIIKHAKEEGMLDELLTKVIDKIKK